MVIINQVKAGEVFAFDCRVLHRTLKHIGSEERPILYYTFSKRWFTDPLNFADLPSLREAEKMALENPGQGGMPMDEVGLSCHRLS